ncbi:hypothetical protein [Paenibacillus ginsengarvi]|uniref:hypothetical protein n=1 Tax=Paenibacillus ginsengarvi TaxID=400777 RepID=UPI001961276F|nr:hypothetical protein [Paenibacillus ginsengarvi]
MKKPIFQAISQHTEGIAGKGFRYFGIWLYKRRLAERHFRYWTPTPCAYSAGRKSKNRQLPELKPN